MSMQIIRNLIAAAAILVPTFSHAALVINNLAAGTQGFAASMSGPTAEFFPGAPFDNRQVAFSFTTGAEMVTLTNLTFALNVGDPSITPIEITLSTGSVVPGGTGLLSLGTVAPLSDTPISQVLTLTPSSTVTLNPSTEYWLHFTVPAGGGIYTLNNGNAPTLAPGWALGNSWYYEPDFGGAWTEVTSGVKARVNMNVESVPEPTTAMLGATGLLFLLRRRR